MNFVIFAIVALSFIGVVLNVAPALLEDCIHRRDMASYRKIKWFLVVLAGVLLCIIIWATFYFKI